MSYKFYINIYRKVLTHAIYHDIVISTNKKAGDTYQANTGTQKERHPYYNTGEKVKQYEKE